MIKKSNTVNLLFILALLLFIASCGSCMYSNSASTAFHKEHGWRGGTPDEISIFLILGLILFIFSLVCVIASLGQWFYEDIRAEETRISEAKEVEEKRLEEQEKQKWRDKRNKRRLKYQAPNKSH